MSKTKEAPVKGPMALYQKLAERHNVPLPTILESLPEGSISIGAKHSQNYHSVSVHASVKMRLPTFDPTDPAPFRLMQKHVKKLRDELLREAIADHEGMS